MSTEQLKADNSYRNHFPYLEEDGSINLNLSEEDAKHPNGRDRHMHKHCVMSHSMGELLGHVIEKNPSFEYLAYLQALRYLAGKVSLDSKRLPRCFTIRQNGVLTYLPPNRDCELVGEDMPYSVQGAFHSMFPWARSGRVEVVHRRWGAAVRHLWRHAKLLSQVSPGYSRLSWVTGAPEELPDKVTEAISNLLKGHFSVEGSFDLVEGEDIRSLYREHNYDSSVSTGSLSESCMRHDLDHILNSLDLYVDNPSIKLLVLRSPRDPSLIRARALVWTGVTIEVDGKVHENQTFLDRIYGTEISVEAFKKYAKENGWWHRYFQSYDRAECLVTPQGEEAKGKVTTGPLLVERPQRLPFLDTLCLVAGHSWEKVASRTSHLSIKATFSSAGEDSDEGVTRYTCQGVPDEYEEDYDTLDEEDYWDKTTGPKWLRQYFKSLEVKSFGGKEEVEPSPRRYFMEGFEAATFDGANLREADLRGPDLRGANLNTLVPPSGDVQPVRATVGPAEEVPGPRGLNSSLPEVVEQEVDSGVLLQVDRDFEALIASIEPGACYSPLSLGRLLETSPALLRLCLIEVLLPSNSFYFNAHVLHSPSTDFQFLFSFQESRQGWFFWDAVRTLSLSRADTPMPITMDMVFSEAIDLVNDYILHGSSYLFRAERREAILKLVMFMYKYGYRVTSSCDVEGGRVVYRAELAPPDESFPPVPPSEEGVNESVQREFDAFWDRVISTARENGYLKEWELVELSRESRQKLTEALFEVFERGWPATRRDNSSRTRIGEMFDQNDYSLGLVALERGFAQYTRRMIRRPSSDPVDSLIELLPTPFENVGSLFNWSCTPEGSLFWRIVYKWWSSYVQETLGACELALTYDNVRLIEQALAHDPSLSLEVGFD